MIKCFNKDDLKNIDKYKQAILSLEKECFPIDWQYPDSEEYFGNNLLNFSNSVNLFYIENDKIIAYLLATCSENSHEEISEYDKNLIKIKDGLYLETIEILPDFRGKGILKEMLLELIRQASIKNKKTISLHSRTVNNFSEKIKRIFTQEKLKIIEERKIENWHYGGNEPYQYLCFELEL